MTATREQKKRYNWHKLKDHRRRAKKYNVYYEPVDRFIVFERDGWLCHYCGLPALMGDDPTADAYPTLDHLVPMRQGGPHTYDNVATCHKRCNYERDIAMRAARGEQP